MNISNALNNIMNAKRSGKEKCILESSKLLIEMLKIMKKHGYVDYKAEKENPSEIVIEIKKLNECKAITPRFYVGLSRFDRYIRRFLPARDIGIIIISTSKGLMTHQEALEKGIGGSLIAYCY